MCWDTTQPKVVHRTAVAWRRKVSEFLLAARPLSRLARVSTNEEYEDLRQNVAGTVNLQLLESLIKWLHKDREQ